VFSVSCHRCLLRKMKWSLNSFIFIHLFLLLISSSIVSKAFNSESPLKVIHRPRFCKWQTPHNSLIIVKISDVVVMRRSWTTSCRAGLTVHRVLLGLSTWDATWDAVAYSWGHQSQLWVEIVMGPVNFGWKLPWGRSYWLLYTTVLPETKRQLQLWA